MDDRTSEASTNQVGRIQTAAMDYKPRESTWEQLSAFDSPTIAIETKLSIDGPSGTFLASYEVTDWSTGELLALELRTDFLFPQDLPIALLWFEERIQHFACRVSPF